MPIPNPQERYETTMETRRLSNGRLVYRSLCPKAISFNVATDIQVKATDIARMDKLAYDSYGSAESWWKIASANGRVDGSLYFRPGTIIVIPSK